MGSSSRPVWAPVVVGVFLHIYSVLEGSLKLKANTVARVLGARHHRGDRAAQGRSETALGLSKPHENRGKPLVFIQFHWISLDF